ncbi:MAG: NAD(P)/FAD-dependent oxidoreductase [Ferruginibacter sp.]
MTKKIYDIIVIGAGSGGLSIGLFMQQAGFSVLMVSRTAHEVGGDCLNDGCVPSKSLIHVSRIAHAAKMAAAFGLELTGKADLKKAQQYVQQRQAIIRAHEDVPYLEKQGITMAIGKASFINKQTIRVNDVQYEGKKIVIATGSLPVKLKVPGSELVKYYDNKNVFDMQDLPAKLLIIGGGPIGIEMAQAFSRLGSSVTVVDMGPRILQHDDVSLAGILQEKLAAEGITFIMEAGVESFSSATEGLLKFKTGETKSISFDTVFVGIGRRLETESLQLENAGIQMKDKKIVKDDHLRTTNKNVFVCGDIAGDLMFSHAAEFHARIILNNFFSPLKKKLDNRYMSWVTFTDPELASFGLNEEQLKKKNIAYLKLAQDFSDDDRAVTDNYRYAKTILYISKGGWLRKSKILGGSMLAPGAGELVQELILAMTAGLSIDKIFNKIYPYPTASRINQQLITKHKSKSFTGTVKRLLRFIYKYFS